MAQVWNNTDPIVVDFSSVDNSVDNDNNLEVSRSYLDGLNNKGDFSNTAEKLRIKNNNNKFSLLSENSVFGSFNYRHINKRESMSGNNSIID